MTVTIYIGFIHPLTTEQLKCSQEQIGYFYSNEQQREIIATQHFTAPYVYELKMKNEFEDLHPQAYIECPVDYENAKKEFEQQIRRVRSFLKEGEYCQLFASYVGDEQEAEFGHVEFVVNTDSLKELYIEDRIVITLQN